MVSLAATSRFWSIRFEAAIQPKCNTFAHELTWDWRDQNAYNYQRSVSMQHAVTQALLAVSSLGMQNATSTLVDL